MRTGRGEALRLRFQPRALRTLPGTRSSCHAFSSRAVAPDPLSPPRRGRPLSRPQPLVLRVAAGRGGDSRGLYLPAEGAQSKQKGRRGAAARAGLEGTGPADARDAAAAPDDTAARPPADPPRPRPAPPTRGTPSLEFPVHPTGLPLPRMSSGLWSAPRSTPCAHLPAPEVAIYLSVLRITHSPYLIPTLVGQDRGRAAEGKPGPCSPSQRLSLSLLRPPGDFPSQLPSTLH